MRRKSILAAAMAIFLCQGSIVHAETAVVQEVKESLPAAKTAFKSAEGKYEVTFPKNWEIKRGFMGMDVIALSAPESPSDLFRENANVIFADLDKPMTKESFYDQNIVLLEKLLTDYKLEDEGTSTVGGEGAKWIRYTHRMGEVNATVLQYLILKGNRAYVITFTANPPDFGKYEPVFKEIVNSFKLN